ncbi:hypothetical protein TNCV_1379351 [Trichonephila clavipes]|nr:hypothetical protein TNCV_1379351 [Trichonephila clavipes]
MRLQLFSKDLDFDNLCEKMQAHIPVTKRNAWVADIKIKEKLREIINAFTEDKEIFIECTICLKWRKVPGYSTGDLVPKDWECSMQERNLCRRIDVCDSLLKRHENDPFLKRTITGDEKGHGAKKMNLLKSFPKPIFTKKSCQVIYSQFGLAIHQNDHQAKRRFVEWAQNDIAVVPDFHKRILFSDEAHFWLNGYVNKQNCRIWSEANPQVYVETPLHPEKLTVWCALWAGGILLQKR